MATVQIFLSAVTAEFRSYRDELRRYLERPNVSVKVQEDFIATGRETLDKLDTYIRQCDAVIHLVGDMTGALAQQPSVTLVRERYKDFGERLPVLRDFLQPGAPALSYTQWEAWLTLFHRKVLIIAAPEAGATRDDRYVLEQTQRDAQQAHLARLASVERYPEFHFDTADSLAAQVLRSGLYDIMAAARVVKRPAKTKTPPKPRDSRRRYLRGYAFDPHLQTKLEPGEANEIVYSIPLERLYPGPCGDLVEVIDHDPASGCFYEPVDLEDPAILKPDGLAPSEANPKFHQQMIYAVAMTTIEVFEQALGRRVLWSARLEPETYTANFVQKLRIYPHALRAPRAYYDAERKAILFGYFPIPADFSPQGMYPEGVVFTCLSQQTIVGEMAHAIVDGMYPSFTKVDSRDMLAFKLAFADIVALLQHFSMPGVLRHVLVRSFPRGSMGAVFAELGVHLRAASADRSALRDAIGTYDATTTTWKRRAPDATAFARAQEPADRGAIVVAAILDAYVAIVDRRATEALRDLGTEIDTARGEALPAELVEQLEDEAVKTARELLAICVRALDYCPPVDVDGGDFLRALITADQQAMPQDESGYRAAVVDAFRAHGIHPLGFRSLSVEMLPWDRANETASRLLQPLIEPPLRLHVDRLAVFDELTARERFETLRKCSLMLYESVTRFLRSAPRGDREMLSAELSLDPATPLEVFPPRVTTRTTLGGARVFIPFVQSRRETANVEQTRANVRLRGGSTIAMKFGTWEIEYIVRKRIRA